MAKSKDVFKGKLSDFGVNDLTSTKRDKAWAILSDYTSDEKSVAWAKTILQKYDHDFTTKPEPDKRYND